MEDELSSYLAAIERDGRYVSDAVLKESPVETTQRVSLELPDGTRKPFIRKYIARDAGIGGAYERIHAAQQQDIQLVGVPCVRECWAKDTHLVVVMDYVEGETLAEAVRRRGASLALAAKVFEPLCDTVAGLHEMFEPPLIHRDLKPGNIMLGADDLVTLIDFGIARTASEGAQSDTTHFGTRGYAPPEQFGFAATDERSDIYALGLVLWFCLVGKTPIAADRQRDFESSAVPEGLRRVIARAASLDPKDRYANVRELKEAFRFAIQEPAKSSSSPSPALQSAVTLPPPRPSDIVYPAEHRKASQSFARKLLNRVPRGVGMAWNACVLIVFAFFFVLCISIAVNPIEEPEISHPLWARVLEYPFMLGSLFAAIAYALMDKRRLRARFAILRRFRWWQEALVIGGVVLCIMIFVCALTYGL